MAKEPKPKNSTVVDAAAGEGTGAPEAVDPKVAEAVENHKIASENAAEMRKALADAEADEVSAKVALDALTLPPPPPPITGPRIILEESGEVLSVPSGYERERRLLLFDRNYEHVSDVLDQGETVWVYRRM